MLRDKILRVWCGVVWCASVVLVVDNSMWIKMFESCLNVVCGVTTKMAWHDMTKHDVT